MGSAVNKDEIIVTRDFINDVLSQNGKRVLSRKMLGTKALPFRGDESILNGSG